MATSLQYAIPGSFAQTFTAGATLTVGQAVKMDSTVGQVVACTAATDVLVGFVQSDSALSGEPISIVVSGPALVLCGATAIPSTTPVVTGATAGTVVPWTASGSKRQFARIIGYGGEAGGGSLTTAAGDLRLAIIIGGIVVD
jgi:hypothetical protein